MMVKPRQMGRSIMPAHVSTTARTSTGARASWVPALIVAILLIGLVAAAIFNPYRDNPASFDGTALVLGP
jgi:hypothetical protein